MLQGDEGSDRPEGALPLREVVPYAPAPGQEGGEPRGMAFRGHDVFCDSALEVMGSEVSPRRSYHFGRDVV